MAKKKVSSKVVCESPDCTYSPSIYIDFDKLAEVKGLGVGDKVKVLITGTIKSVEQRESYDDSGKTRASIALKDFEAEIADDNNVFASLAEDDDE